MRLLANENFPREAVEALRAQGHDVIWMHSEAPGRPDAEVLARARAEDRILMTFDKDFGELAFRQGLPASGGVILFRMALPSPEGAARKIAEALAARPDWQGHFSIVEDGRVRMRPLPAGK